MYVILAPIQIASGFRDRFVEAMIEDARDSVANEEGCLRFDVIQDAGDADRIWVYEVYTDEAAFQHHMTTPHFLKWKETVKDWRVDGPKGALKGSDVLWPAIDSF
jgi:autoinducer 2-degrading protein